MVMTNWQCDVRRAVEDELGAELPDDIYLKSLTYATKKQEYLAKRKTAPAYTKAQWYLVELTAEAARSYIFSDLTVEFCRFVKKEESAAKSRAQHTQSIIADSTS